MVTKLVRKLKQMSLKKAHRKAVQKRKIERAERELTQSRERKEAVLEELVDEEMARIEGNASAEEQIKQKVRMVGDLVLDVQKKKSKRLTRKQAKRKERNIAKGEGVSDTLAKKWEVKKRRVKARAQVRNSELDI